MTKNKNAKLRLLLNNKNKTKPVLNTLYVSKYDKSGQQKETSRPHLVEKTGVPATMPNEAISK